MKAVSRPKDRDAVIQSLRAGVVPRAGQRLILVGRTREIETMLGDIERVADGGSTFRLVIGEYGSGKTFFLNLVRSIALEKKLVVATADLNPDRRLHASGGQARSLYAELMRNIATRAKPDGGALSGIVEKFVSTAMSEAKAAGVDNIHFNMEVWERRLFEWINPGKAERIGWDHWVRWMCDAVEVFGTGVQPSFVSGVEMARPHGFQSVAEAVKSSNAGFEYLMSRGILPRPQQWRREPSDDIR